jgi:hypothetical protein
MPDLPGEHNRLYRIGVMLINGYGYNWYREDNQMRADDLLIRSRASEYLERAAARLREREARYRRAHLPPPTREHPDPDPQHLVAVRQLRAAVERILEIDTELRGAAVPPEDKVWRRHRGEIDMLRRLGECDAILVGGAKAIDDLLAAEPPETAVDAGGEEQLDQSLGQLAAALARRNEILAALV